jgi:hypothetical protein
VLSDKTPDLQPVQSRWLVVGKSSDQAANASIQARSGTTIAKARMLLAVIGAVVMRYD